MVIGRHPFSAQVRSRPPETWVDCPAAVPQSPQVDGPGRPPHRPIRRDSRWHPAAEIGAWIGGLSGHYTRGTCEQILGALRMVLDYGSVDPNPARDNRVRLPRRDRQEVEPPTAREVEAIIRAAAPRYRLPLVVLEATGMRVGELETLRWGDVDDRAGRWRVARQHEKAGRGRWVNVPPDVFAAVAALVPREDRDPGDLVFPGVTGARLRTDMARACRAAGIPLYSPHDLRHRRISLLHEAGVPWARIGEAVGQRNVSVTADTYTHVIAGDEVDRGPWLVRGGG